jgi:hypothetical protein
MAAVPMVVVKIDQQEFPLLNLLHYLIQPEDNSQEILLIQFIVTMEEVVISVDTLCSSRKTEMQTVEMNMEDLQVQIHYHYSALLPTAEIQSWKWTSQTLLWNLCLHMKWLLPACMSKQNVDITGGTGAEHLP